MSGSPPIRMTQLVENVEVLVQEGGRWLVQHDHWIVFGLSLLFLVQILAAYRRWIPWCIRHPVLTDLLLILGCSVFLIRPLVQPGAPGGHDIYFHLCRVAEMHWLFQDGYYLARWAPDFNYGFGYPLFNFYPSLIYYLAQPFRMLGLGTFQALNLVIVSGVWLSGLFMYVLGKEFWGRYGGVVCAVAYLYIPYRLVTLYVRGAIPEFYAMTFMPLIFWSFYKMVQTPKVRHFLIGAISYGLIIPAHNVTAVFFTLCLIAYSLFLLLELRLRQARRWKEIVQRGGYLLGAALLGISCMSWYWLPAMYEKQFVQIGSLHSGYHDVAVHFVAFFQFFSRFWGYGGSGPGLQDGMSFQLGLEHLVVAALSLLVVLLVHRQSPPHRNQCLFFLVLLGGLVFAMTSGSLPIWRAFPLIGFISFPWRLLSLTGFGLSFLCGGIFLIDFDAWRIPPRRWPYKNRLISLAVVGGLLGFTVGYCRVGSPVALPEEAFSPEMMQLAHGAALNGEYLPIWVEVSPNDLEAIAGRDVGIKSGEAQIEGDMRTDMVSYHFTVTATTPSVVQVGSVYFPGWKAYNNGLPIPLAPEQPSGLATLPLSLGTHDITIRFEDTPIRTLGQTISLASAALVCGLLGLSLRKRP